MKNNYRRRHNDVQIDLIPRWMSLSMMVLKWMMVMIPFVICSIMMFVTEMNTNQDLMWTCIYIISLMNIIKMADEK